MNRGRQLEFGAEATSLRGMISRTDTEWLVGARIEAEPLFNWSRGADGVAAAGDLIVDGVLYEFKTSSRLNAKATVRQLAAYYALNSLREKPMRSDGLGILSVRHGIRLTWPAETIVSSSQLAGWWKFFEEAPWLEVMRPEI